MSLCCTPCLVVAVACALGSPETVPEWPDLKANGHATLTVANRWVRACLPVEKRTDYRRGQRPKLGDLHLDGKAIVCVLGHYVFVDGESYWSFFDNENDDVVAVWRLKEGF